MTWPVLARIEWAGGPARRVQFRHFPGHPVPAGVRSEPFAGADVARFHEAVAAGWGSVFVCSRLSSVVDKPLDVNKEPGLWKKVRQAAFSIEDGRWGDVLDLFRGYGVARTDGGWFTEEELWAEPLEQTIHFLRWFRAITALWEQASRGNSAYVREHARWDGRAAWWFDEGEPAWLVFATHGTTHKGTLSEQVWLALAREAVFNACQNAFQLLAIEIRPVEKGMFAFQCTGWQAAAFAQWFLQNVATAGASTCPTCGLPFLPRRPNQKYCSRRCRRTARERRKAGDPLRRRVMLQKARERMRRLRAARRNAATPPPPS